MGVVFEAFDRVRNAPVALKRLDRLDPTALHRFKREFRARADVVHRNLVTLHELVGAGDRWFFTMELLDGAEFLPHVRGAPDPGHRRLRAALIGLAEGLAALHASGLVHRDVKPSNVIIDGDRVVLLDFGLVSRSGVADTERTIMGTPAYLAPELINGASATATADWYGLGVMLFEALAGRLPFDGTALQVLIDKTTGEPPGLAGVAPDAPPDLIALCDALLAPHPERRPGFEEITGRLAGERRSRITAPPAAPDAAPLIGRHRELAALDQAFARTCAGRAALVTIAGESGIGKTRLVRHFLDLRRQRDGALILEGRCYERESVPYQGVDSLIDALTSHLAALPEPALDLLLPAEAAAIARLFPVLRRLEPLARAWMPVGPADPQLRRRALAALRVLLTRLATARPLVLFVDDLQWGDLDGGQVLAELVREPEAPPLLLICALRSEDAAHAPAMAQAAMHAGTELLLEPLSPDESRALAEALVDPAHPERARGVAREARGHPMFALELARHRGSGTEAGAAMTLPAMIRDRLARLPASSQRLLELIAVAGRPLPLALVERAAGCDPDASAALRADHLIRSHGARSQDLVEPYHDQIRVAVREAVADRLPALYRSLATALEATGRGDPEALTAYWRGAREPRTAARYAAQAAARAAEALAFARAAELYAMALHLDPTPDHEREHELRLGHGHALASAGRGVEAARAYVAAVSTAPSAAAGLELRRLAAEQLLRTGQMRDGIALFEQVFHATGVGFASTPRRGLLSLAYLRARVRMRGLGFTPRRAAELAPDLLARIDTCWAAASGIGFSDVIRGAELQTRGLLLALRAGEPMRVCRALSAEACFRATDGGEDDRRTRAIIARAEALARQLDSPHGLALCGLAEMLNAFCRGHWAETLERAAPTIALFRDRCTGAYWEATSARHLRHWALAYLGRLPELSREVAAMLDDAETFQDVYASNYLRTGTSNLVWLARDQPDEAEAVVVAAMAEWPGEGFQMQDYNALQSRVHVDLYTGHPARALARLDDTRPALRRSQLLSVQQIRLEVAHLRGAAALAAGAGDHHAVRAARQIAGERMQWSAPLGLLLSAAVAWRAGDRADAAARLRAAAAGFDAAQMAVHGELARLRLGTVLGDAEGDQLGGAAQRRLGELSIAQPDRWAAMWAPGFVD